MTSLGNDDGEGGRPALEGNDDEHIPDGFATLKGRLDPDLIGAQADYAQLSHFMNKTAKLVSRTFTTHRRDFVFTLDNSVSEVYTPSTYGGPTLYTPGGDAVVLSALNGIEALIGKYGMDKGTDHRLIELFVLSHIRVLGQAYVEMVYDQDGETSGRSFAIQFGGIMTKKTTRELAIGEYVRYGVPTHEEFNSRGWSMDEGIERSKIGLILCPVRESDGMTFGMQCYALHRLTEKSRGAKTMGAANSSDMGVVTLGKSLEAFVLSCALQGVYRLMQFGVLQVEQPKLENGLGFMDVLNGMASLKNRDAAMVLSTRARIDTTPIGSNFTNNGTTLFSGKAYPSDRPLPTRATFRTRGSSLFYTANNGTQNFETWVKGADFSSKNQAVIDVGGARIKSHTSPEEVTVILAELFGLVDDKIADTGNQAYTIKDTIDHINISQKAHMAACKEAILASVFSHETDFGISSPNKSQLSFGFSNNSDQNLSFQHVTGSKNLQAVDLIRNDKFGAVNSIFKNSLPLLWCALSKAVSLQKSIIAGKVTRSGGPHQAADIMFLN
jgi:hypothetical protein